MRTTNRKLASQVRSTTRPQETRMHTTTKVTVAPATGIRETPVRNGFGGQLFTTGRNAKGQFANWRALTVRVTPRGHWYRTDDERDALHNDTLCRGCGHHGHFDYILDNKPCTKPATAEDVVGAF